jgi:hypothetical protein
MPGPFDAATVAVEDGAAPPLAPSTADAAGGAMTADDLEAECRGFQVDRRWAELERCADQILPLAPKRAEELKALAVAEAGWAPQIARVEAALRANDLGRAKAELDKVPAASVDRARIARKYEVAKARMIDDLTAQLERAKDADCKEYNELLAKEKRTKPSHIVAAAMRRTSCTLKNCDAEALAEEGRRQSAATRFSEALTSYEKAYACNLDPVYAEKAFQIACQLSNLGNLGRAKQSWKQMTPPLRQRSLNVCVHHGITEQQLNAP